MDITVVIPARNSGLFLKETVDSLRNKELKIIICDNASEDNTEQICSDLCKANKNITYIRQKNLVNIYMNYWEGIKIVDTKYLAILPGKDLVDENYFEVLLSKLEESEENVLVYTEPKYFLNNINEYSFIEYERIHDYNTFLQSDNEIIRVLALMKNMVSCHQQFGLYKTKELQETFQKYEDEIGLFGFDHLFLTDLVRKGKFILASETHLLRRSKIEENIVSRFVRYMTYYYMNNFKGGITLENIYTEYQESVLTRQIELLGNCAFKDEIEKEFYLTLANEFLEEKLLGLIDVNSYKEYSRQYKIEKKKSLYLNFFGNKRIFIFGTGELANELYEILKEGNNKIEFIDNHRKGEFRSKKIYSIEELVLSGQTFDRILTSVEGNHDIALIKLLKEKFGESKVISWKNMILYTEYKKMMNDE